MIGELNERYTIQEKTEEETYSGTEVTWVDQITVWGKEVDADAKVQERFDSLDPNVESIIKLKGEPDLSYSEYRIQRVSDGQKFLPTAQPTRKGEFTRMTFIGVKRG